MGWFKAIFLTLTASNILTICVWVCMCTSIEGVSMCVYVRQTYRHEFFSSFTSPYAKITFLLSKANQKSILIVTGCLYVCMCCLESHKQLERNGSCLQWSLLLVRGIFMTNLREGTSTPPREFEKYYPNPPKNFFSFLLKLK